MGGPRVGSSSLVLALPVSMGTGVGVTTPPPPTAGSLGVAAAGVGRSAKLSAEMSTSKPGKTRDIYHHRVCIQQSKKPTLTT